MRLHFHRIACIIFIFSLWALPPTTRANWSNLGLYGGQIYDIAIDPDDNAKMFAGAYYGDGLFVTVDGGVTWNSVLTGQESGELDGEATFRNTAVWSVKIAPSTDDNPENNIVWAVHNYWAEKSTDGGASWTHIQNRTMQENCTGCGGATDRFRNCRSLAIDPTDSNIVYVGTGGPDGTVPNGAIYKTTDGGTSWKKMNQGNDLNYTVVDIAIDPQNPAIIWAITDAFGQDPVYTWLGSIYRSTDGGENWSLVDSWATPFYDVEVKSDESNAIFVASYSGILKFYHNGSIWTYTKVDSSTNIRALAFDPSNPQILYAAGKGTSIARSTDGGSTFTWYTADLQFLAIAPHPTNGNLLFGGELFRGVHKGVFSGGNYSWTAINTGINAVIVNDIAIDPYDSTHILAATFAGLHEKNGSNPWTRISNFGYTRAFCIAFDTADTSGNTFYSGAEDRLYKTTNGGSSWTNSNLPGYGWPTDIAIDGATIFVTTRNSGAVHKSTDSGVNWTDVTPAGSSFDFNAVAIDPTDSNHILVGGGNYFGADVPGKLFESTAGGAGGTWSTVLDNVTVNALLFDPDDAGIVYAGCGYSGGTDIPLYRSTDGGSNWKKSYEGIPGEPTRTGVWGSAADDVFVLSHNGSLDHNGADDRKLLHFNGSAWSAMDVGVSVRLNSIHGTSGSSVFSVGDTGAIVHYNGSAWNQQASGTVQDLLGVWSFGSTVLAVGKEGTILCTTDGGNTWLKPASGTLTDLSAVWGSSLSNIYAVGSYGLILYSADGLNWSPMDSGLTARLLDIWGASQNDIFAVGRGGTILHFDGAAWSAMTSGTSRDLYAVWGISGSDVFAAGDNGTLLHYNGSSWSTESSGTSNRLYGVWASAADNVYAVGLYGAILHTSGPGWNSVTTGVTGDLRRNWNAVTDIKYLVDSTLTSNVIYAGTSRQGIYVSPNQGGAWALLGPPLDYEVLAMATGSCIIGSPNGAWQSGVGTILGWVTEYGSIQPIPDAKVSVTDTGLYDHTDTNGIFMISGVWGGPSRYQLNIQADGYGPESTLPDEVWVYGGSSTRVDFLLENPLIAIVTDLDTVEVPEGGQAAFGIRLSDPPAVAIAVTVSRSAGDADIGILSETLLLFDPANWYQFQPVHVSAAEDDGDTASGNATIRCVSTMATNKDVTAVEVDDDFELTVAGDGHGMTEPFGTMIVDRDSSPFPIHAMPFAGYTFQSWVILEGTPYIEFPNAPDALLYAEENATVQAVFEANTVAVVTDLDSVNVPEGGSAPFQAKLSAQPAGDVIVTAARTAGDDDITVTAGNSLIFTTADWNVFQPVTLFAAEDGDAVHGSAVITCAATLAISKDLPAVEVDNDFVLTIINDEHGATEPAGIIIVDPRDPPLTVSAIPDAGYTFSSWTIAAGSALIDDPIAPVTTITALSDATVQAVFIVDLCPDDPNKTEPGVCGCGVPDIDTDEDTVLDCNDLFPEDSTEWSDNDGDGIGDNADPDDDNDGMPDDWEEFYGLNPLVDDAIEDFDGDGYTNLAEYLMGSDPSNPRDPRPPAMPWLPLLLE